MLARNIFILQFFQVFCLSWITGVALFANDESNAAFIDRKGEVKITGLLGAGGCIRVKLPNAKVSDVTLEDLFQKVSSILNNVNRVDRGKGMKAISLMKESLHHKIEIEDMPDITLLEFLVILAKQGGICIEITDAEIVFRECK